MGRRFFLLTPLFGKKNFVLSELPPFDNSLY